MKRGADLRLRQQDRYGQVAPFARFLGDVDAMLEPGERVAAGQPVGRLWFMDKPERPPELLRSPVDGIVVVTKAIPITEQGDCVFVVGTPIAREALL